MLVAVALLKVGREESNEQKATFASEDPWPTPKVVCSSVTLPKLDLRRYICERLAPSGL